MMSVGMFYVYKKARNARQKVIYQVARESRGARWMSAAETHDHLAREYPDYLRRQPKSSLIS